MKTNKNRLFFLLAAALVLCGCGSDAAPTATKISVGLAVEFGGESIDLVTSQSIHDNATVVELLAAAVERGSLTFEASGNGETAFVKQINGVENQLGGGSNWVYFVNGEQAAVGAGVKNLADGDKVLWKFTTDY